MTAVLVIVVVVIIRACVMVTMIGTVMILLVALMTMVIHLYTHRCSGHTCNFFRRSKVGQRCIALAEIANTQPGIPPIRIINEYVRTQRHPLRNLCVGSPYRRRSPLTKVPMLQGSFHGYVGRDHEIKMKGNIEIQQDIRDSKYQCMHTDYHHHALFHTNISTYL